MQNKEQMKAVIHELVQNAKLPIPEGEKGKYEEMLTKIFCENQKPQDVMGFSNEMMEHIYAYGYRLFNLGNYKQAAAIFQSLTVFDPYQSRFALALGASYHRQKNLRGASQYYLRAGFMNPEDPFPFFYLYDVYTLGEGLTDAQFCLEESIRRMGDNPTFAKMKEKCVLYLEGLKKQIEELRQKGELVPVDIDDPLSDVPSELKTVFEEEMKAKELKGAKK